MVSELVTSGRTDRLAWLALGVLAIASVALSYLIVTPAVWLDDPWIGYRYAQNLHAGHGLVFNPGDPIEGYTAFLWIVFAYLGIVGGIDPLAFLQAISVVAQAATLVVVFQLGRRVGRSGIRALLAPALLAFHVSFVTWSMMGMSTSFLALLVTLVVVAMERRMVDSLRGSLAMGALLFVICLTRFDGLILTGVLVGYAVLFDRELRKWLPGLVLLGVGLVVYNGWRMAYYGEPLPNTFHAKQAEQAQKFTRGAVYVWRFFRDGGAFLFLIPLLPLVAGRATRTMKICAWTFAFQLLYCTAVGGDWMVDHRFVLPVLPLAAFLLQESVWHLRERARGWGLDGKGSEAALAALALVLVGLSARTLWKSRWVQGKPHSPGAYWSAAEARTIAQHLDQRLPEDALVATEWAGIIPYEMRQPILDIFGLNDGEISSLEFPGSPMGRGITPEYLVTREPDLVIVVARIFPTVEEAAAGIDARPASWIKGFYSSLSEPEFGYELCVMAIDERGYWPCLIRPDHPDRESLDELR